MSGEQGTGESMRYMPALCKGVGVLVYAMGESYAIGNRGVGVPVVVCLMYKGTDSRGTGGQGSERE